MYFSKILEHEGKQRLNLSTSAFDTLVTDMEVFSQEPIAGRSSIPAGVINHIFDSYREAANASISRRLEIREAQLNELFGASSDSKYAIRLLLKEEEEKLKREYQERCKAKGCPISFRVNDKNFDFLAGEGQAEAKYYQDDIGLYIKAVIEEYAQLPYPLREKIYCSDLWKKINEAINDQWQIKITLKETREKNGTVKKESLYVKPYKLYQDSEKLYNYLVGYIRSNSSCPWSIGAIRLSSVKSCSLQSKNSAISAADKKKIEDGLRKHGVQYLSSNEELKKILVQFTPNGEKMYYRLLHLRPACTAKYENRVYEFTCSQWQAINYFFKFGADVKILEPQKLACSFYKRYQAAAKQYEMPETK